MENIPTTLFYSAPLTPGGREDNWQCDGATRPPEVICNFRTVGVKVGVGDVRTAEDLDPTLDTCGFQKFDFRTQVDQRDFLNHGPASIEAYVQETKSFLKDVLGADDILHFDTCVRQKDTEAPVKLVDNPFVGPYQRVHVDQNPTSARARLRHHAGATREVRRFQIINVWRALVEPVKNFPLALLDYRTLDPQADLVVTRRLLPEWMHERWVQDREGYSLKHRAEHRWYHWSALTPEEVVIFKCHDSASKSLALSERNAQTEDERASDSSLMDISGLCPHTAFFDSRGPAQGHLRSSADLRFLVLYN
jgi:cephamycin C biosynthesis protein